MVRRLPRRRARGRVGTGTKIQADIEEGVQLLGPAWRCLGHHHAASGSFDDSRKQNARPLHTCFDDPAGTGVAQVDAAAAGKSLEL